MKTSVSHPFPPISIITSLSSFRLSRDTDGIHEAGAMWLLYYFLRSYVATSLSSRISLKTKSSRKHQKEETLTTYFEVVNYLPVPYAADDVINKNYTEILRFKQQVKRTSIESRIMSQALRCNRLYKAYVPKSNLI